MPPPLPLPSPDQVIGFWRQAGEDKWWVSDPAFDAAIRVRFLDLYEAAARGELGAWEDQPDGALALIIVLDQFPRNLFRGSPRAFATDAQALAAAGRARQRGFDQRCAGDLTSFAYMPFMHSEALADQELCVSLFEGLALPDHLRSALEHRDLVARFGRFPHRNAILGRAPTAEERLYLDEGGFKG